jgi:polygalacturonase
MNTASITQHHAIPFAAAAAAVAAAAVVGIGSVVVPHDTATASTNGPSSTHQEGPGFGRSFFDRRTTGGTVMVGP